MPSASPGAYGWGAESVGGRGGTIKVVSNLNNAGAGSLRAALEASGARIVVFTVSGLIDILTAINVINPYLTWAGQTAPGSGIVLQGESVVFKTHNIIAQYIRWRLDNGDTNPIVIRGGSAAGAHDIMLDHLSFAWQEDDAISMGPDVTGEPVHHITVQNCLFTEPEPATGGTTLLAGGSADGSPDNLHHVSILNNLFSSSRVRCPNMRVETGGEVINNVVYNFTGDIGEYKMMRDEGAGSEIDYINNYWDDGPLTGPDVLKYDSRGTTDPDDPLSSIYIAGNHAAHKGITDPATDNWPLITHTSDGGNGQPSRDHQRLTRLSPQPTYPVPLVSATVARIRVFVNAGANARLTSEGNWVFNRDSVDDKAVDDAENGTGPDPQPSAPGVMPDVVAGSAYTDTDGDGMADDWENLQGLDPNDASDGPLVRESGYTNIENFLNGAQEEENGEGESGGVSSPVVILGASSTPEISLGENTEIDDFWESYFRDIERAQNA